MNAYMSFLSHGCQFLCFEVCSLTTIISMFVWFTVESIVDGVMKSMNGSRACRFCCTTAGIKHNLTHEAFYYFAFAISSCWMSRRYPSSAVFSYMLYYAQNFIIVRIFGFLKDVILLRGFTHIIVK